MTYDYKSKKIVAVLATSLEAGAALNVLGHLALSLGAYSNREEIMGRPVLVDASGIRHIGISRYPVIVTKVKPGRLRRLIEEARQRSDLFVADYPKEMLETGHDDELAAAVEKKEESAFEYLGAILYGGADSISELTGKFTLWS